MPAGRGPLRIAIEDFIETTPLASFLRKWYHSVGARRALLEEWIDAYRQRHGPGLILVGWAYPVIAAAWVLFGGDGWGALLRSRLTGTLLEELIEKYAEFWGKWMTPTAAPGGIEAIGSAIADPILAAIGGLQQQAEETPENWLRRIYGLLTVLTLGPGIAAQAIELAGVGQLEGATAVVTALSSTLGTGIIGAGAASALVESGFKAQMERALLSRYRPARFNASQLRDLYALGEISESRLDGELSQLGWRDNDKGPWKKLAHRTLTESDIFALFNQGLLSETETIERLRALGFATPEIMLLFALHPPDLISEASALTLRTARKSLKEGLITEAEFRTALANLRRGAREIDLEIALIRQEQEDDLKSLTIGQVKEAWEENVLSDGEARFWLMEEGLGSTEIDILLRTWRAGLEPKFRKLNKGTVVGAYVEGILTRPQALSRLVQIGLLEEDARLELDLAEARNPEQFGAPAPQPRKHLAVSVLSDLLAATAIDEATFLAKVVEQDYSSADAALLLQAARLEAAEHPRALSESAIADAYVAGVIDRTRAETELAEADFAAEDIPVILDTVERQHPEVFAPETVQAVRLPSTSALVEAVRNGILEEADYYARMAELGYMRPDADMYLALAKQTERKKSKVLTPADIANAYEKQFLPYGEAIRRLVEQGYSDGDAILFLRLRANIIVETEPWKMLLAGRLEADAAFNQLLGMGFTSEEINEAIEQWQKEAGGG